MPCNTSRFARITLLLYVGHGCTVLLVCSVKCGVVCVRVCVSVCLCTYLSVRLSVCVCQVTGLAVATASGSLAKSCAGCHDYCHGHHVYPQNVWAPSIMCLSPEDSLIGKEFWQHQGRNTIYYECICIWAPFPHPVPRLSAMEPFSVFGGFPP